MLPYILLVSGLLMIFLEFYLPGGIMGVLGALTVLFGIIIFANESDSLIATILFSIVSISLIVGLFRFALWRIRHEKPGTGIYSGEDQEGFIASTWDRTTVGKTGIVESDLRPGGRIKVEGKRYSAISQSGYLPKGTKIVVLDGQGETLIVKLHEEEKSS